MAKLLALKGYNDSADSSPLGYEFECPGCGYGHFVHVREPNSLGAQWTFTGNFDKPTFRPSILVFKDRPDMRCHSFVTDGQIKFLSDCYHSLAGQTVTLPDIEDE